MVQPVSSPTKTAGPDGLGEVLLAQAEVAAVPTGLRAEVTLEAGHYVWTARFADGRMEIVPGYPERPAVRVMTDPETLAAVATGEQSGVEAFLRGRLKVRGNLALALRLDSMLNPNGHHARWPRWGAVKAAGVHTVYLEAGRADGPPVVMLHGLGATNASLLPTIWDLAADHRVIAPDLPGFGDSGKPLRPYHAAFFANWLAAFCDELGVGEAVFLGNSMGGRVALEMGLRHPGKVRRLVLLAPAPAFIRHREFVRLVRLLRPELALLPVPISHTQVVKNTKQLFAQPSRLPDTWFDAAADEFIRVFSTPRGRIAFFSAARQIYLEEPYGERGFWDRLPSLERPALFVWGSRDRLVPHAFARHVTKALPKATSVVIEDCGHVPQYERPEETNVLVREFLEAPA